VTAPSSFDLPSEATALEAFTLIVTSLGWAWDGPDAVRLQGRTDVRHSEEIAWGVDVTTNLSLRVETINGEPRYVIHSTASVELRSEV